MEGRGAHDAQPTSVAFGITTIALTLMGWSSIPLFLRHFAEQIDAWTANGWRYGFSALVWAPVLAMYFARGRLPRGLFVAALIPSIINAAGQVCFTYAHYRIEPGLLTFGLRSQLLFVAAGAWVLFPVEREIIRRPGYLIGVVLLMLGMTGVLVLDPAAEGGEPTAEVAATGAQWGSFGAYIIGVTLALASGVLFAAYGLAVRKCMRGINSMLAFAAICQFTAAIMVALMLGLGVRGGLAVLDMEPGQIALLLASALIGIAIGHVFYYMSLVRLGVAVSAGVLQLQPFLVAIASFYFFHELLTTGQWVSGFTSVVGALLMLSVQWSVSRQLRRARRTAAAISEVERPLAIAEGESGA